MDFFNTIFDGLVSLSEKLPAIEIQTFYIVVVAAIAFAAVVIGLTFFASSAYKMKRAAGRVLAYLENEDVINDDNVADFTASCFGTKAPIALRDTWVSYLGVRFGYPGEVLSESAVFDKEVKRPDFVRASIFIAVALILTALFSFWGLGAMATAEVGVVLCLGLLVGAIGYIALLLVGKNEYVRARKKFVAMQDELDAKVNLQVERDYATDASPLLQVAAIMDGIIARNIARPAPTDEEVEAAVRAKENPEENSDAREGDSKTADDVSEEGVLTTAPVEEPSDEEEADAKAEELTPIEEAVAAAEESEAAAEEQQTEQAAEQANAEKEEVIPADEAGSHEDEAQQEEAEEGHREEARGDVAEDIENNDEDEENMFGRKKKKLQQAELAARGYENEDLELDSEVMEGDDGEGAECGQLRAPAPVLPYAQQQTAPVQTAPAGQQAMACGSAPESLEGLNVARCRPQADQSVTVSLEPEVIYVEEDLDEGDEDVKPPKLVKLPQLLDYVLSMKQLTRSLKLRVALLMIQAYNVFKNSPENKAIVLQCLKKVMKSLMAEQAAMQAARAKAEQEAAAAQAPAEPVPADGATEQQ